MALWIKNANIFTMDEQAPRAESAVVIGQYFAYVGSESGAKDWLDGHPQAQVEVMDAKGQMMLPGFNDSHMHFLHYARAKLSVDLYGTGSMQELLERMRKGLESYDPKKGLWLMGEGWNQDFFSDEKRCPTCADLNKISSEYPIIVMRACFHIGVLNSKAMELLHIDRESVKQYGSFAETFADGEPNGVIKENVFDDIKSNLPFPSDDVLCDMLCESQYDLFKYGVTSVQSDDFKYVPGGKAYHMMDLLRTAAEQKKLKVRMAEQCLLTEKETVDEFFARGCDGTYGNRTFKMSAVKILSDGSLGARTALMRKPYADDPSTKGLAIYENQEDLDYIVLQAHRHNMPALIHAIGDGAVEMCLNAIERARREMPYLHPRHGIVHCQITSKEQIRRFQELDVVAYIQPIFIDYDMHIVYDRVGKELGDTSYAWKDYLDLGVAHPFGTDCPVESFRPLPGIYCAVTRRDLKGRGPYLPEQAFTVEQALRAYTAAGAYASYEEDIKGQVKTGYLADFCLLDRDLLTIPHEEILKANVTATYVDGECVYQA
ncbi:MAG: amidohydrolase [Clostridiaceae bacterium]|nr:amidohydrolase [Clostridiaceae bacterium]